MPKFAKAIALITDCRNDGSDYALREDGIVFNRSGYYDEYGGFWTKSGWTPVSQSSYLDGVATKIIEAVKRGDRVIPIGFASRGHHLIQTENLKIRLPAINKEEI